MTRHAGVARVAAGPFLLALLLCASASARGGVALAQPPHLHVTLPSGWSSKPLAGGGLVAAEVRSDLAASVPANATFSARPASASAPALGALIARVDRSPFVGVPSMYATSVAGHRALYVQWTAAEGSGNETTRTIVVALPTGSYTFTLEAPASKWTPSFPEFDRILASVSFG